MEIFRRVARYENGYPALVGGFVLIGAGIAVARHDLAGSSMSSHLLEGGSILLGGVLGVGGGENVLQHILNSSPDNN
jgi:hypothetical protein